VPEEKEDLRGIEWAIFDADGLTKPRIT